MAYRSTVAAQVHVFDDLKTLLAKASPARSGDSLAGVAACSDVERMAARFALAELPEGSGLERRAVRPVHPSLRHISAWISSVGAGVAPPPPDWLRSVCSVSPFITRPGCAPNATGRSSRPPSPAS